MEGPKANYLSRFVQQVPKNQVAWFERFCYGIVELVTEFKNYDESAKNAFAHYPPKGWHPSRFV